MESIKSSVNIQNKYRQVPFLLLSVLVVYIFQGGCPLHVSCLISWSIVVYFMPLLCISYLQDFQGQSSLSFLILVIFVFSFLDKIATNLSILFIFSKTQLLNNFSLFTCLLFLSLIFVLSYLNYFFALIYFSLNLFFFQQLPKVEAQIIDYRPLFYFNKHLML